MPCEVLEEMRGNVTSSFGAVVFECCNNSFGDVLF
jgi:hypothetical protein